MICAELVSIPQQELDGYTCPDLIDEDLRRGPVDLRGVVVHTVHHQRASSAYVVDGLVRDLL